MSAGYLAALGFLLFASGASALTIVSAPDDPSTLGDCTVVSWRGAPSLIKPGAYAGRPTIHIRKPGKYCLDRDYYSICYPAGLLWEHSCSGVGISISANDVGLDLRGHTVTARGTGAGIHGRGERITIRNGVMKGASIGIALDVNVKFGVKGAYAMPHIELRSQEELHRRAEPRKKDPQAFAHLAYEFDPNVRYVNLDAPIPESGFLIENMVLEDDGTESVNDAIVSLSGAGNIIRNLKLRFGAINALKPDGTPIHADAHAGNPRVGILNYGPRAVVENNEIIQDTDNKERVPAYAIYLRNAADSLVRNNRLDIRGTQKKTIAIGLRDSKNVRVEKNRVRGGETFIERSEGAYALEAGNEHRPQRR